MMYFFIMNKKPSKNAISAWANLFAAYRNLRYTAEDKLVKAQLPPLSWYDVLWAVYRSPEKRTRQYLIGKDLLLEKHNLSRLLDRLEKEGLIIRRICSEDRRGKYIQITDEGVALLKKMWAVYGKVIQEDFAAHFSENDLIRIGNMLVPLQTGEKIA
jgi:DNA-binding MarR family transcriptional regulator